MPHAKLLHHIATAIGFAWLIGWFYLCKHFGVMDWGVTLLPQGYEGAGLMLVIGLMMVPAFFIWSRFNRFVEKKLEIKGKYYEDEYYTSEQATKHKSAPDTNE